MPGEPIDSESPEVQAVRRLARIMQKFDLTALDIGEGSGKVRLRRGSAPGAIVRQAPIESAPAPVPHAPTTSGEPAPAAPLASTPMGAVIESPMVGTFYSSSGPDSPAFVSAGTSVRAETTVCIIEAMKVFTEIPAGIAGTVAECLVKTGQPVEYGQPLFRLQP